MPEITLVFGPNNTFFFDCPKSWKFHNIPPTLRQLFNSSMSPPWRIAQPYCLALAPQLNAPEPLWYIGCKTLSGEDKIFYSQNHFDSNYPELSRWTKTIPNAPRSCYVTFGKDYSYFASAPGHGSIWAGIPSDLSDKVQKAFDTPCNVALGAHNAWFVMWPDGYFAWKFHGHYSGLDKILNEAEPRSVSYLAISPYNKQHYFVAFRDRTIKYNFTGAPTEWLNLMQEVFDSWQAELRQIQQGFPPPQPQPMHGQPPPPSSVPYAQQQGQPQTQWVNAPLAPPPNGGFLSPQTPNTLPSNYSSPMTSPAGSKLIGEYRYQPQSIAIELPADTMPSPPPLDGVKPPIQTAPVEMPGDTLLSAPAPVPVRSSSDKKKKFFSRLFD